MTRIIRDYDKQDSGNTETHLAVDIQMKKVIDSGRPAGDTNAYEEGFASASGVRPESAETGGRIRSPENKDKAKPSQIPASIEKENAGLADS